MNAYTITLYPYTAPHTAKYRMTVAAHTCSEARQIAYEQIGLTRDAAQPFYIECGEGDLQMSLFGEVPVSHF